MRAVIQRGSGAEIAIEGVPSGAIGCGLVVFLGIIEGDSNTQAEMLAKKLAGLRIFTDEEGKMNRSVLDIGGEMLIVSNFTLGADCRKGKRPSFVQSAAPEAARPLYDSFVELMRASGIATVLTGCFGAHMQVSLNNDGPVTIFLDTDQLSGQGGKNAGR